MASHPEQIVKDRRIVAVDGKAIKRATAKWRRRQEKRDLENAPIRNSYRGWVA